MGKPIRYGVVGLGRSGWSIHAEALRHRADSQIVAVTDLLPQRRSEAQAQLGCRTYATLGRMTQAEDLEVVVIANLSARHGPDTIKALRAGVHVAVEKPMAMSVRQADHMIAVSKETGRRLFVHQNQRFSRWFTHLREIVDSGLIGRLYHVRMYHSRFDRRNDWQTLSKYGGGELNNTCPHFIDIILQLLGAPVVSVLGDLQQIASAGDVEDHVKAFLKAENGCTADMEISSAQAITNPLPQWILCGSCGTLTSDGRQSTIRYFDPAHAPPIEVLDAAAPGRAYGNDDILPWQEKTVAAVGPDIGSFYDNVTGVLRRGEAMHVTPESAREVVRVTAVIRKGTGFPGRPTRSRA